MRIGTISFERRGDAMSLSGRERADKIMRVVGDEPDLLVCAGWTLDTDHELQSFATRLTQSNSRTAVILEVRHDEATPGQDANLAYLVQSNRIQPLGRQIFVTSIDWEAKEVAYRQAFPEKLTQLNGRNLIVLTCGEINLIKGRDDPQPRAFENELLAADIIVNPTHDRMGNGGTINSKRKWLSQKVGSRNRLYISASNWNTAKPVQKTSRTVAQKRTASTLHAVFLNREPVPQCEKMCEDQQMLYRTCEVDL